MNIRSDTCAGETCFYFELDETPYILVKDGMGHSGTYCRQDLGPAGSVIGPGIHEMRVVSDKHDDKWTGNHQEGVAHGDGENDGVSTAAPTTAYLGATHLPACLDIELRGSYFAI